MGSWEELDRERVPEPKPDEFAIVCGQVFTHGPGAVLLKMLRAMTIERSLPEAASEAQIRELEAQRRFVRRLENATDKGRKPG